MPRPAKRSRTTANLDSMTIANEVIDATNLSSSDDASSDKVIIISDSDDESVVDLGSGEENGWGAGDDDEEGGGFDDEYEDHEHELELDDFGQFADPNAPLLGQAILDEHLQVAAALLAESPITIVQISNEIRITIPVDHLEQLARDACGLTFHPINVALILGEGSYRRNAALPGVRVRHGDFETSTQRANKRFPVGLQLSHATRNYLAQHWDSARSDEFLVKLCETIADRVKNAGNYCMMCDSELPFPGVKPTVCDKHLCAYQLEGLGLGAGLALFETDPKVADLLISAAVAACRDTSRQSVSPLTMPPPGADNIQITPSQLVSLMEMLPRTNEMMFSEADRSAALNAIDPKLESHIAWLFATNRAHIVSLPENRQFADMQTPHQFKIHTSTRQHAERFEALRARHGSFFAFHGSSMSNWHNILRQNLKNASNTPMMSAGAAFGEGIYMALQSTTSAGYCRSGNAWRNSEFGTMPQCIALVEVANSSRVHKHANGIVVAADENCVMLRYLFVYGIATATTTTAAPTVNSFPYLGNAMVPSVQAKSLAGTRYCNTTTIAFGSTYDEVVAAGNLLITDNDTYFWDIEEVVEMVKGKHGLFINGYTHLPFTPPDVAKILNHPKAASLRAMEQENAAQRALIPHHVISHLNSVGRVCREDRSEEFVQAHGAIADLRTWLAGLDKKVRDALDLVPFTVRDSHTAQQIRNTVSHSVELVTSGGECVHRFGDFLMQIR